MKIEKKVIDHFTYSSECYAKRKGMVHDIEDPIILNFIKETSSINSKVLEVGGGSGYMLDLIESKTNIEYLYNCEIVPEIYRKQVNKKINLIGGNALNLPFKDSNFDYVIFKNVLHHLVDKTRKKSRKNAIIAVEEITRVAKNGSYIIILEQYNKYKLFASAIFYITFLFSLFKITLNTFKLNKNVIVSFLTPNEIKAVVPDNIVIKKLEINRIKMPIRFKLTLLMSNIGRVLLIGKCLKNIRSYEPTGD